MFKKLFLKKVLEMNRFACVCALITSFVSFTTGNSCSPRCSWSPWNAWSACTQTCGGGTRYRTRPLCCRADIADFDACVAECGLDRADASQHSDCGQVCFNGHMSSSRCVCDSGYRGYCCDIRICCGDPGQISNGYVTGSNFCHGDVVTYHCNTHYNLTGGTRQRTCYGTYFGLWSGIRPSCAFVNSCGSNPCQNGATCIEGLNQYTCACDNGWSGTNCEIDVLPPSVTNCPSNVTYRTADRTMSVNWTVPTFTDEHGTQVLVTSNFAGNAHTLDWGEYTVQYVATKTINGLRTECVFNVNVHPYPCNPPPSVENGVYACNGWNGRFTEVCALLCREDQDVGASDVITDLYVCGGTGVWSPIPTSKGCSEKRSSLDAKQTPDEAKKHYYPASDCQNSLNDIKINYLSILNFSPFAALCSRWDSCNPDNVHVIC